MWMSHVRWPRVCGHMTGGGMTVSSENATHLKSTKSRNSDSSVSRGTDSNWDVDWARGGGGASAPQLPRVVWVGPKSWRKTIREFIREFYPIIVWVNESCRMYEWVMVHVWMRYVAQMNASCRTYEWVMLHIWMRHVAHMNGSCCIYEWVLSHIWMSHVTHMNGSCRTYECVMLHVWMSHVIHVNKQIASLIYTTWSIHMCDMPLLYMWLFFYFSLFLLPLPLSRSIPLPLRPSLSCWSKCARENTGWMYCEHIVREHILADIKPPQRMPMTRSYVWHDSFACATWLIHVCVVFICVTCSYVWHAHLYVWRNSSNVFWRVHVCDMTH